MSLSPATAPAICRAARLAIASSSAKDDGNVDDRLATRLFYGDFDAVDTLRLRHTDRLLGIALSILEDEDEAVEIVDRALDDACRGWPPTRGGVGRWLGILVRRRARARVRGTEAAAA